jgi:hypothetical protein
LPKIKPRQTRPAAKLLPAMRMDRQRFIKPAIRALPIRNLRAAGYFALDHGRGGLTAASDFRRLPRLT